VKVQGHSSSCELLFERPSERCSARSAVQRAFWALVLTTAVTISLFRYSSVHNSTLIKSFNV